MQPLAEAFPLTNDQLLSFRENGYLVVDDVLNKEELERARQGMVCVHLRTYYDDDGDSRTF